MTDKFSFGWVPTGDDPLTSKAHSWTEVGAASKMQVAPVRGTMLKALLQSGGSAPLKGLMGLSTAYDAHTLARAVKDSAVDGLVTVDNEKQELHLTALGKRVASLS
ncbi:MAG: hypothetical protein AAF675_03235 [Pseudomonadota bacterium]